MTSPRPRSQAGSSLIEVLVSLLIFSFGLLGITGLYARATQVAVSAEDVGRASLLAGELASTMWAQRTLSLNATTKTAWQTRVSGSGLIFATGDFVVNGNVATITVLWREAGSGVERRYETQVAM